MLSLLYFEWKKSFGRWAVLSVLFIFTIIDLANTAYRFRTDSWFADSSGWQKAYWQLYGEIAGTITQEKLNHLQGIYGPLAEKVADLTFERSENPDSLTGINEYSDYLMLERFYVEPMRNFLEYGEQARQVAQYAQENIQLYTRLGNTYECRKNAKICTLFADRQITSFAYTEIWERLADYTFSTWLTLLLCLFAVSASFSAEKEIKMDLLLCTMPGGRKQTVIAKCLSSAAFAILVAVWFSLWDMLGFAWNYQTTAGLSMPVYALGGYANTPLQCSVGVYFLLCAVLRALGVLFFSLLCCGCSALFSNALYPFFAGCGLAFASCAVSVASDFLHDPCWRAFNPASLLFPKSLFASTEHLNCLGEPIPAPMFVVAFALLATVLLVVLLCRKGKLWTSFAANPKNY